MHIPILEINLLKGADAADALLYSAAVTPQAENRLQALTWTLTSLLFMISTMPTTSSNTRPSFLQLSAKKRQIKSEKGFGDSAFCKQTSTQKQFSVFLHLPRVMELILPLIWSVLFVHLKTYATCFNSVSLITRLVAFSWFSWKGSKNALYFWNADQLVHVYSRAVQTL